MANQEILDPKSNLHKLTERQLEILRYVCQGLIYKEIGKIKGVNLEENTIKSHMGRIYLKLGLAGLKKIKSVKYYFNRFALLLKGET